METSMKVQTFHLYHKYIAADRDHNLTVYVTISRNSQNPKILTIFYNRYKAKTEYHKR